MKRTRFAGVFLLILLMAFCARPASAAGTLEGTWIADDDGTQIEAVLAPDGRFTRTERDGDELTVVRGTYRFADGVLEIRPDGGQEVLRLKARLLDENTLELTPEGGPAIRMARKGAAPLPPPGPPPGYDPAIYKPLAPDAGRLKKADGGHILYTHQEPITTQAAGQTVTSMVPKIFVMTGDGQGQAPFICPRDFTECQHAWWTPDGRGVLFVANFEQGRSLYLLDIFLADLAGGTVRRLTGNEWCAGPVKGVGTLSIKVPVGSPWSEEPLFGFMVDPQSRINVACLGSGGRVFHPGGLAKDEKGQEIAHCYEVVVPNLPAGDIWVRAWINKHIGGSVERVTVEAGRTSYVTVNMEVGNCLTYSPSITPDGRYLVARRVIARWVKPSGAAFGSDRIPEQSYSTLGIWDLTGRTRPLVTWDPSRHGGLAASDPRISPDGKWIAFSLGPAPCESIAVCSVADLAADRPEARVVAAGSNALGQTIGHMNAAWSPNGRRLAFVRYVNLITAAGQHFAGNLFVANADGSGLTQITRAAVNQCPMWPSWSPDGKRIAFYVLTNPNGPFGPANLSAIGMSSDIWTIGADGANPKQLTRDGRSSEPAWGP